MQRVLIVGQGSIGNRHLSIAREFLPHADIRVLRHRSTSSESQLADGSFSDIAEAVSFSPNISVIAWPATHHIGIAQYLADCGSHLLIEKPLSSNENGIVKLLASCCRKKLVCMVGYNLRYVASLQAFREACLSGTIGRVLSVRAEIGQYLPDWRPTSDYRQGVTARQELGGGVLLELSHEIDYLRWIFGDVDWVQAVLSRHSDLEINVEDTAYLILGFSSNDKISQTVANVTLDFVRRDLTRSCTAIGAEGSLRWIASEGLVEQYDTVSRAWKVNFRGGTVEQSYKAEWRDFLNCIETGGSPLVSGIEGAETLAIVMAARMAAQSGCRTSVAPLKTWDRQ